jgi:hypothetical protein
MVIADSAIRVASATDRRNRANSRLRPSMTCVNTRTAAPQPAHVPNAWPMRKLRSHFHNMGDRTCSLLTCFAAERAQIRWQATNPLK